MGLKFGRIQDVFTSINFELDKNGGEINLDNLARRKPIQKVGYFFFSD